MASGVTMQLLTERYRDKIRGVLSCFDRVVLNGTIPEICHQDALALYLNIRKIRFVDYTTNWAQPLRDEIRQNAQRLARDNAVEIEYIRRQRDFRKEQRIKEIVAQRGNHPGLVHIFSAMESCPSFRAYYSKRKKRTTFRYTEAKCIHFYFYFIDDELGLCYLRVPTWVPFRLQFYFNAHNYLAAQLTKRAMDFQLLDNAFVHIDDFATAQKLADALPVSKLHRRLNRFARLYCPVIRHFRSGYHWSIREIEYATDIVFKRRDDLHELYESLTRTVVHSAKAEHISTFLGRKLTGNYQGEIGNDLNTRIQGTRIRHQMGPSIIKMYDKFAQILRIETTTTNVTFFKHHRRVEHRDGSWEMKLAPVRKTIYSLPALRVLMGSANQRYLQFISTLDAPTSGGRNLDKISRPVSDGQRTYRGFNLFHGDDLELFHTLLRGEFNISGFTNRRLRPFLGKTGRQLSLILKRLRVHGLIKKIRGTYKYYLTRLGRRVILTALHIRYTITPAFAVRTL
jgi:hypothetical protein